MAQRARAGRGKGVLAGVGLGQGDEFLHGLGRHAVVNDEHAGHGHHVGDGGEILDRVIGQLGDDGRVGAVRGHRGHAYGVAIGRSLGNGIGTDGAARAAAVLDHHGLAQHLAHLVGQQARDHVGRSARAERHDQAQGTVGVIGLGMGQGRQQGGRSAGCKAGQKGSTQGHGCSPGHVVLKQAFWAGSAGTKRDKMTHNYYQPS
ncbi:hypothetical protein D3C78_1219490 [compost metagenome]